MKRLTMSCVALSMFVTVAAAAELPKPLVDAYLQVQTGLTNDKIDNLASNAKAIETAATALGADAAAVVEGAKKLGAAKDLAAARTAFGEMSEALVTYVDKSKTSLGDLQVAFCPMVRKPWLQKEKDIRNPYYGTEMLTCGSFKK